MSVSQCDRAITQAKRVGMMTKIYRKSAQRMFRLSWLLGSLISLVSFPYLGRASKFERTC
jgi:hypothetical protein